MPISGDDLRPGGLMAWPWLFEPTRAMPRCRVHADFAGIEHRNAEDVAILRRPGA